MAIILNHTIVPSDDRTKSASEFAALFGLNIPVDGNHFSVPDQRLWDKNLD